MAIANSDFSELHRTLTYTQLSVSFGEAAIAMPLSNWVKNALMAIFFFFAGLELKRELIEGALARWRDALLPLAGATGGIVLPAFIYLAFAGSAYAQGWAIPAATDIAFALGALALLGPRVPVALKAFLLAVAVVDDLGAILIVAFVYTEEISWMWLAWAGLWFSLMVLLNRLKVAAPGVYLLLLIPLWVCLQNSGVNPTIAGVLAAACIPMRDQYGHSPLEDTEHAIRPYVMFGVMPVFALATAGASLGAGLGEALSHPIALGIAAGLAIGKPFGITLMTVLAARLVNSQSPGKVSHIVGVSCVAGIGFTMSLFIGALAFVDPTLQTPLKMGVYAGSLLAGTSGLLILFFTLPNRADEVTAAGDDPARPFLAQDPDYRTDRSPVRPPLPRR
jgi:NhaA family Na+:H+ antiporter